ncbi:MAG: DUF4340 domain-containing protein [Verrucomicrobiaceae bacterium]
MRHLTSIFLALLALGLGTLVLVQTYQGSLASIFGAPARGEGDRVYQFSPNSVGRIEINNHDGTRAIIEKKGGAWVMEEPWEDISDPTVVQALLSFASNLIIEDVIDRDEVEDPAEFGLSGQKIEVQLFDRGGSHLCHFNIGRYTAWRTLEVDDDEGPHSVGEEKGVSSYPTVIIWPAEREQRDYFYVCGDRANPALRKVGIRTLFDGGLKLFRNHGVFYRPPHFAAEISFKNKDSEIVLKRDHQGESGTWRVSTPFDLAANSDAVASLIAGLSTLRATAILDKDSEALPKPLPENLAETIQLKFFLPDGSVSLPTTVYIYPPKEEGDLVTSAIIGTAEDQTRPAILKLPRADLAKLPRHVNELRSRTLTSLQVAQVKSLKIDGHQGNTLGLSLEFDPHERAKRWHANVGEYQGAANEEQVKLLFEALFVDEIVSFSDDAATDLSAYGLDKPLRKIDLQLTDGSKAGFLIGESMRDHFYVQNLADGRIAEVSPTAFQLLAEGKPSPEITPLLKAQPDARPPVEDLALYGLDKGKTISLKAGTENVSLKLGSSPRLHFYSSREGAPRVTEISPQIINKITMRDYHWRSPQIWNIDPFEIRGLVIQRSGQPPIQLSYNFFSQSWKARLDGQDITPRLNINKANRLLEKLSEVKVHRWLGPVAPAASNQLENPNLTISVMVEEVDDSGKPTSLTPNILKIAQVVRGSENRFFYGSLSADNSFFLLDLATVRSLAVNLIE